MASRSEQAIVDLKKFNKTSKLTKLEEIYSKPIEGNTLHALTNITKRDTKNPENVTTHSEQSEHTSPEAEETVNMAQHTVSKKYGPAETTKVNDEFRNYKETYYDSSKKYEHRNFP